MAPGRIAVLLSSLRESQLLDPKQVEEIARSPLARGEDPIPLAKELVQRYGLTSFQANQLLRGRGKALVLGPYRVLDRLGEGGMGQVYKAFHQPMNRVVALKVIRKEMLANPQAVGRFYQEVRAAAQLTHPNIVHAHDAGQIGETHYFAMEYVEGIDLAKLVKERGPLPVAQACEYIRQAALGLQHAHERRLVHRDIKPSNLLLAQARGSQSVALIKILDLGLARPSSSADETTTGGLTQTGTVVGTPHYLAPEQAPNSRGVDIRADLYSLGCTLFFLLTGRPPFAGQELTEILLQHQMDPLPDVATFRNDVSPGVQTVLRKLTAKKPEDRYQTPAELAIALAPLTAAPSVAGETTSIQQVRGTSPAVRVALGLLRRRAVQLGAAALGGILVLVLVISLFSGSRSSPSQAAGGPSSRTNAAPNKEPDLFDFLARETKENHFARTPIVGGLAERDIVDDMAPEGGLLIGFEVSRGTIGNWEWVSSVRPIYLTPRGEVLGRQHGKSLGEVETFKARKGYAVGGAAVNPAAIDLAISGFTLAFLKIGERGLKNSDSYVSPQIAGKTERVVKLGDGTPVVGISVKKNNKGDLVGLGLIVLKTAR